MLPKRYESTEVDRRTWLHVPSGTLLSTSSDTHQVVKIQKETSTKMYHKVVPCRHVDRLSVCNIILSANGVRAMALGLKTNKTYLV